MNEINLNKPSEEIIEETRLAVVNSPEVNMLAERVNVNNPQEILSFGKEPAENISRFADRILSNVKPSSIEGSGKMLKKLSNIITQFDKKDFEEPKGLLSKIFKISIEALMEKYKSVGSEIDTVYTEIVSYEADLKNNNEMLDRLFDENITYYRELEKYVCAGRVIADKLKNDEIPYYQNLISTNNNQEDVLYLQKLQTALEMVENRIYDLETARAIAMQTAPQIRMIQNSNYKLISKINSAFVITIPIFKSGIVQAVALKKQAMVAESMEALDKTTNELLLKNAQNIKEQSTKIAQMTSSPAIKIETLEESWNIIKSGIEETKRIEADNKKTREESLLRISEFNDNKKLLN